MLILLVFSSGLRSAAKDKAAEKRRKDVELKLDNFEHWCNDLFIGLPKVVFLPEPLDDGKEGLLTLADVVENYRSMSPDSQRLVEQLLLTFDDKHMVFHSAIPTGRDLLATVSLTESALDLDSGVAGLVSYPWLREKFGSRNFNLPRFMDAFVRAISDTLIGALDVDQQREVRRYKLVFEDLPYKSGVLWLQVNRDPQRSITMSPLFVRTVFAAATSENRQPCSSYVNGVSQLYKRRERTVDDIDDVLNIFVQHFREGMAFPIAHELAHVYLPSGKARDEYECDLAAIRNLQQAGMPVRLGAFHNLLVRAIQEQREDLWGIENGIQASQVIERLCRLKKQMNLTEDSTDMCSNDNTVIRYN